MVKISLLEVWARKRRLLGTFLAVFIGVAFLSGTLTLGDTLSANFDTLFSSVTKGTDAVVRGSTKLKGDRTLPQRGPVDGSLVARVSTISGVARAVPYVQGYGTLLGKDGKAVGGNGPPRQAANPTATASTRFEPRTCRRVAPTARRRADSRVRWAAMIENVL